MLAFCTMQIEGTRSGYYKLYKPVSANWKKVLELQKYKGEDFAMSQKC